MASWGLWDVVDVAAGPITGYARRRVVENQRKEVEEHPERYTESERSAGFGYWGVVAGPLGAPIARGTENLAGGVGRGLTRTGELAESAVPVVVLVGGVLVVLWLWRRR